MMKNVAYDFVIPCFIFKLSIVRLADDVILFAKSKERVRSWLCFKDEIDSKNFFSINKSF